jgi:hypothetical protein
MIISSSAAPHPVKVAAQSRVTAVASLTEGSSECVIGTIAPPFYRQVNDEHGARSPIHVDQDRQKEGDSNWFRRLGLKATSKSRQRPIIAPSSDRRLHDVGGLVVVLEVAEA